VITPEHVEIALEPAGLGGRFLALLVDLLLVVSVASITAQICLVFAPLGVAGIIRGVAFLLIGWGYHVYFEVKHQGQSPGKRVFGLRVVDGRGLPLALEQSFIRNAVRALDALPLGYALGAITCLVDPERRRLGDLVADTLVVRETRRFEVDRRVARERIYNSLREPRVLRMIGRRVGLEEREFLAALCLRAESLDAGVRFDIMEEVAAFYRERLDLKAAPLSGESLVRGLAAIVLADRAVTAPATWRR
jgi:uncharacterized RDD family membrane protein YckC